MPRPGPRRPIVALRLDDETIARIDALAETAGLNRSEMIRELLEDALGRRTGIEPSRESGSEYHCSSEPL